MQYFAPSTLAPIPKNILFILDCSGTMGGTKLEQTKNAMSTILSDLRRNDRLVSKGFLIRKLHFCIPHVKSGQERKL